MQIRIIAFTKNGADEAAKLLRHFQAKGDEVQGFIMCRYAMQESTLIPTDISLREWTKEAFEQSDALLFIGATGIAVRAIAPFIRDKKTDPAVVVVDERATYSIPILSGHIGGANALAREIGKVLNAQPIVSTATDLNGLFAVDEWATEKKLVITDLSMAKKIAASLLQGESVRFSSVFPIEGTLPKGLRREKQGVYGIHITYQKDVLPHTLKLIPKVLTLGIGCKRGTPLEKIEALVWPTLQGMGLETMAIKQIASINLKQDEEGLLAFARQAGVPIQFFGAEALNKVKGDFTPSAFVKQITTVDNVCERAAVAASKGTLVLTKKCLEGVTLAIALEDYRVDFNL